MAKVIVALAVPAVAPAPLIVTVPVLAAVGVPEMTPVFASSESPAGSVPLVTEYVTAPLKLVVAKATESVMAVFTVPLTVCVDGESDDVMVTTELRPAAPLPAKLIALTSMRYDVPAVSPVNSSELTSPRDVHDPYDVPPFVESRVSKSVIAPPEPTDGEVHETEMANSPAVAVTVGAANGLGPSRAITGRTW
jgi:hypothetical protein